MWKYTALGQVQMEIQGRVTVFEAMRTQSSMVYTSSVTFHTLNTSDTGEYTCTATAHVSSQVQNEFVTNEFTVISRLARSISITVLHLLG